MKLEKAREILQVYFNNKFSQTKGLQTEKLMDLNSQISKKAKNVRLLDFLSLSLASVGLIFVGLAASGLNLALLFGILAIVSTAGALTTKIMRVGVKEDLDLMHKYSVSGDVLKAVKTFINAYGKDFEKEINKIQSEVLSKNGQALSESEYGAFNYTENKTLSKLVETSFDTPQSEEIIKGE